MTKTSAPKQAATSKAVFQTMEEIRAFTADTLSGLGISRTRYDVGFHSSFERFGNALHPGGYDRLRSRNQIIAGLQKPPTKTSGADLQNIEAVRQYLDDHLAAAKKNPPDSRLLYGCEDAHLLLWSSVDPMGYAAAANYLPR
jgi:hypothetical protein